MKREVLPDKDAVATRAAALICASANAFLSNKSDKSDLSDNFSIALAGGSTPKLLYQLLSRPPWKEQLPWNHIHWFLGDERFVPLNHSDSNYRMIRETLFDPAAVPPNKQFPMQTELPTPHAVAEDYAQKLVDHLLPHNQNQQLHIPTFNLMLLGMGDDGHTASLFPHTAALDEQQKPVLANHVEKLNTWRLSITPPVLLAAAQRIVLVTGEEKAPALAAVLHGELDVKRYPAQLLRDNRHTTWLIDEAAASHLK